MTQLVSSNKPGVQDPGIASSLLMSHHNMADKCLDDRLAVGKPEIASILSAGIKNEEELVFDAAEVIALTNKMN